MTRAWKIVVAIVAIAVAVLLMPYLRDLVDLLGSDEDGTDSTVTTLVEWLLAVVVAFFVYTAVTSLPALVARLRQRSNQ